MYDHINHEKTAIIIVKCIFKKKNQFTDCMAKVQLSQTCS